MNINEAFPSKYITKSDVQKLPGQQRTMTIASVSVEIMDEATGETKPLVTFAGANKGLPLNRGNAAVLSEAYGGETDDWTGKPIVLYYDPSVQYMGQVTGGMRLRLPDNPQAGAATAPAPVQTQPAAVPSQAEAAGIPATPAVLEIYATADQTGAEPEGDLPF